METNPNGVYKKSIKGVDALKMRTGGLDASARATLILINGSDSLATLQRKLGRDIAPTLKALLALGLVEPVTASAAPLDRPSRQTRKPAFFAPELIAKNNYAECARGTFDTKNTSAGQNAGAPALETAPSASASPKPVADPKAASARRSALRREAIVRLAPYFRPDLMTVLAPLMKATTDADFFAAINALEIKIAVNQERKSATKLMSGLRP